MDGPSYAGHPCPRCGKPTKTQWLFCPHCEEPLKAPRGAGVDALVRRDTRRTSGFIILLSTLGVLGLMIAVLVTGGALAQGNFQPVLVLLLCLLALVGVSTIGSLIRGQGDLQGKGAGRIFLNALTLGGGLVAAAALLGFAGLVFAFVVCLAGGRGC
jgi:hypothetical protein